MKTMHALEFYTQPALWAGANLLTTIFEAVHKAVKGCTFLLPTLLYCSFLLSRTGMVIVFDIQGNTAEQLLDTYSTGSSLPPFQTGPLV